MHERLTTLSAFIAWHRDARRWTQKDLARRSGVSQSDISRIETGEIEEPGIRKLRALAAALGVPETELFSRVRPDTPTGAAIPPLTSTEQALAATREAIYRGPWSETVAALMYAVCAEIADDRREHWRRRFQALVPVVLASEMDALLSAHLTDAERAAALLETIEQLLFVPPEQASRTD